MMVHKYAAILLVGLMLVGGVSAVTYYVDYQSGSDSNSGLSMNSAFKHAPTDGNAANNAGNVNLQAGDIVRFKGGVTYKGYFTLTTDGAEGNHIVFDGNNDGAWGSGRAIIDLEYLSNQLFATNGRSFYTFQGFDVTGAGDPDFGGRQGVISLRNGAHDWLIKNNVFREFQNWDSRCDPYRLDNPVVYTDTTGVAYNIVIEDNEFFALGRRVIKLRRARDVVIRNNDFGGINRGDKTGWFSTAILMELETQNVQIYDNKFHDGWQYGGDVSGGELCHGNNYIHSYNEQGGDGPSNILIERNIFMIDKKFNYDYGTAFLSIDKRTHDYTVRNNLFINIPGNTDVLVGVETYNINIFNNLIMMRKHTQPGWLVSIDVYEGARENIKIKNNIIWSDIDDGLLIYVRDSSFERDIDYNRYYYAGGKAKPFDFQGEKTFGEWQAAGFDIHGSYGDPKFVYMPSDPGQSSLGDYRLRSDSPLIDAGMDLSSTGFSDDLLGNSRPVGSGWDIGPYEFGGSSGGSGSDTDGNGCVSITEIVAYVEKWQQGQVTIQEVVAGVEQWQQGCP